ncbi:DUF6308 family protein [Geodermatophilus sp. SYSU D00766]
MATSKAFDVARGFTGPALPPIPYDHALTRVKSFCTNPVSGWLSYDLCGVQARKSGLFASLTPWSLLWAGALAGRVQVGDVARFTLEERTRFAKRLAAVPAGDLNILDERGRQAVTMVCRFGYEGVWAPKTTKMAALYRPASIPVLDGYVAMAFGFAREGFSEGRQPRWQRIERVVNALAAALDRYGETLAQLRSDASELVPDLPLIPDLRLLDMIIWTSQDDRLVRAGKPLGLWLDADLSNRQSITLDQVAPVVLPGSEGGGAVRRP